MRIAHLISLLLIAEASCYFAVAYWIGVVFWRSSASLPQSLSAGVTDWLIGTLFVIAATMYWRIVQLRKPLRLMGLVGAVYGFSSFRSIYPLVVSWNVFSGDVVVISALSSAILILIGLMAGIDQFAEVARGMPPTKGR